MRGVKGAERPVLGTYESEIRVRRPGGRGYETTRQQVIVEGPLDSHGRASHTRLWRQDGRLRGQCFFSALPLDLEELAARDELEQLVEREDFGTQAHYEKCAELEKKLEELGKKKAQRFAARRV